MASFRLTALSGARGEQAVEIVRPAERFVGDDRDRRARGDLGHPGEIVGGARLLVAFDREAVGERRVEQRERVARREPGVGVEAEPRVRHRGGDGAQRRAVGPPVAPDLDLEAGEPGARVAGRRGRHAFGIRRSGA